MNWLKKNMTGGDWIKIGLLVLTATIFVVAMDFKVDTVETKQTNHIKDYEYFRYRTVPDTYMRKDVAEQVIIRLERIERKIDNMSSE